MERGRIGSQRLSKLFHRDGRSWSLVAIRCDGHGVPSIRFGCAALLNALFGACELTLSPTRLVLGQARRAGLCGPERRGAAVCALGLLGHTALARRRRGSIRRGRPVRWDRHVPPELLANEKPPMHPACLPRPPPKKKFTGGGPYHYRSPGVTTP